ncbi:MAG TPA: winged helix-turn-helix domain-containing protein [Rhodanobacteraceae bacterium]|nr:winged helix-turn-helix domain-containing protein [Rhodanobacteraceae bacterium]
MPEQTAAVAFQSGRFTIEPATRRLLRDGEPVELEAKVFDLILLLLEQRQRALDKRELVETLWRGRPVTDAALSQLVYKARRALDDDGGRQQVIRTVYGHGLQWVAPLDPVLPPAATAAGDTDQATAPAAQPPRPRAHWRWLAATAAIIVITGVGLWLIPHADAPPATSALRIAVTPLGNHTGEAELDWTERGLPALLASLLSHHGDVDVLDTARVRRAWNFAVPEGEDRDTHLRRVTGANAVIHPRLDKLLDGLYQLEAHVERGRWHTAFDVSVQGAKPARLAVALVARIRGRLELDPIAQPPFEASAPNAYLAETFARGMDAAVRGDWRRAKPYFELMARNDPDFLPARLRLARAQMYTDQQDAARKTLHALIADARRAGQPSEEAAAWLQLGLLDMAMRHAREALTSLAQARTAAAAGAKANIKAMIELTAADAATHLHKTGDAEASLERARHIIDTYHLRGQQSRLYGSLALQAQARGDAKAAEAARRQSLAVDTANGDDGNIVNDDYNLAVLMIDQGRKLEAVPLYARAWKLAQQRGSSTVELSSALNLAIDLINLGAIDSATPFVADVGRLAQQGHKPLWQAFSQLLQSLQSWYRGDSAAALDGARQALAELGSSPPNENIVVTMLLVQATAALNAEPSALRGIAARIDRIADSQRDSRAFDYQRALVQAMAAAVKGDKERTLASLRAARSAPHADDSSLSTLRVVALSIAVRTHQAAAAQLAQEGLDVAHCGDADVLRLLAVWARQSAKPALARQADARRLTLTRQAQQALSGIGVEPVPLAARDVARTDR